MTMLNQVKQNLVLLVAVCGLNFFWWFQLTSRSPSADQGIARPTLVGTRAMPLLVQTSDGGWSQLHFEGEMANTVIYVTSPDCVWCDRNMENVKSLANGVRGKFQLFAVLSGGGDPLDYLRDNSLDFPVYGKIANSSREHYRIIGTPQTVVINPHYSRHVV